jgi:L-ribulose-5-phosphate 4-epimerase
MDTKKLAEEVLEANLALVEHHLVVFTWGNASAIDRESGVVVIKPSGVPYREMKASDMTLVDLDGKVLQGAYKPSSDTPTHLELYRHFSSIGGIVHTHARWSTIWAQSCRDIPPYGTTHADYFYGGIPCMRKLASDEIRTNYELNTGKVIVEGFRQRNLDPVAIPGALIAGHGPFAWGVNASDAVHNAVVMEECAMMSAWTELVNPKIQPIEQELLDKHYFRKHGRKAYYGQR